MENKLVFEKITNCLWFDTQAEEAADFYIGIFKNSSKGRVTYYSSEGKEIHGMDEGTVLTVEFSLEGRGFLALNGGPLFKFNESVSFVINCETQDEIDYYWEKLTDGGDPKAQVCGWLKDKYEVSWQVVPSILADMLHGENGKARNNVMAALMKMKKLDIAALKTAYNNH